MPPLPMLVLPGLLSAALVLNGLVNRTDPMLVRMHWAGEGDVLEVLQRILRVAGRMVGSRLWGRLRRRG